MEKKTIIYIAGKITGLPKAWYSQNFDKWENHFKSKGFEVENPVAFCSDIPEESPHEVFMERCFKHLKRCDMIFVQNNWEDSKGARMEVELAQELGIALIEEECTTIMN